MNILSNVRQTLKRRAVLQKEIDKIDKMFSEFGPMGTQAIKPAAGRRKRGPMSAAAKKLLSAAAKERWKKAKAAGKSRL